MEPTLQGLGIDRLSVPARIELIGLIWDSILDGEAPPGVPDWHLRELERRRAAAEADPGGGIPWEVVKARLARPE
jgi:putative addiction module component (TIGR02574 family)